MVGVVPEGNGLYNGTAYTGSWCRRVAGTGSASVHNYVTGTTAATRVTCTAGERFYVEAMAKASLTAGVVGVYMVFVDAANAVVTATGAVADTHTGTTYTKVTYEATAPANAVGVQFSTYVTSTVTAGNYGYFDNLYARRVMDGKLIVDGTIEATKIAAGTITGDKIAANTIDGGQIIAGTIDADRLTANSITAGQIASGAINTDELASGAITTAKLAITAQGSTLVGDPSFDDATAWTLTGASIVSITDGKSGLKSVRSTVPNQGNAFSSKTIPVDLSKVYRVRCWARASATATTGTCYIGVNLKTSAGANIAGNGTYWYVKSRTLTSTWVEIVGTIGPAGSGADLAFNYNAGGLTAKTMQLIVLLNSSGTTGYHEAQDLRLEEVLPATLIANGAISTDKIAANAITASKIYAGTTQSDLIQANNIATGTITAAKMATGTITAASAILADAVIVGAKIGNLEVDTIKIKNNAITQVWTDSYASTDWRVTDTAWKNMYASVLYCTTSNVTAGKVVVTLSFIATAFAGNVKFNVRLVNAGGTVVGNPAIYSNLGLSSSGSLLSYTCTFTVETPTTAETYYPQIQCPTSNVAVPVDFGTAALQVMVVKK